MTTAANTAATIAAKLEDSIARERFATMLEAAQRTDAGTPRTMDALHADALDDDRRRTNSLEVQAMYTPASSWDSDGYASPADEKIGRLAIDHMNALHEEALEMDADRPVCQICERDVAQLLRKGCTFRDEICSECWAEHDAEESEMNEKSRREAESHEPNVHGYFGEAR